MLKTVVLTFFALSILLQVNGQTDTLKNMPLPRIMDLIYRQKDSSAAIAVSDYLTQRARLEKDSSAVSWGHYGNYLYRDYPNNLPYLDSLIYSTKGLNNSEEIFGLIANGDYYFKNNNEFTTALNYYVQARRLSIETNNEYCISITTSALASIKFLSREFSEALALYHRYGQLHPDDMLGLYFNIANCHYELKNIDSLSYYSKIGIRKSLKEKDANSYESFLRLNGVSQYMRGNYKRALDSLEKSRSLTMDTIDLGSSYYYTALTHEALDNADSTIYYLKEISLLNQEPEIYFPEIKNVFYRLYENAKKNGQNQEQLVYIERFMRADSILESKSKGLISKLDQNFDLPLLEEKRNQLRAEQTARKNLVFANIALSILFVATVVFFVNRFVQQKKNLKEALGDPENYLRKIDGPNPVLDLEKNRLPSELVDQFNRFFHKFERDQQFLD
ncbi:MAG TPA: hypothetical protein VFM69_04445, partial [Pricia sp.]|nr:hypothetical protein [Pricia sp.]